jgi:shikimate dehydrogenase
MPTTRLPNPLKLGVIGFPLEHSLSPAIHQAALNVKGIHGEYKLYPFPPQPEGEKRLDEMLDHLRSGELHGLSVTIPHKQTVFARVDALTPSARKIGAVNTLYTRKGRIIGHNTDAQGFHQDLQVLLGSSSIAGDALVLGAGGAACAVVFALLSDGWRVTLAARRLDQAVQLAARFSKERNDPNGHSLSVNVSAIQLQPAPLSEFLTRREDLSGPLLVVNTTPVGMAPNTAASPWPQGLSLPGGAYFYDLVYNPAETRLVQSARLAGLPAVNGLGMLVHQAALAFERWTGQSAPLQAMAEAAAAALGNNAV